MAISRGSMNRIMGATRPRFGWPALSVPKPPRPGTGVHPVWMKNAVMNPHAMKAAMFGMIIPDRNVPNFGPPPARRRTWPALLPVRSRLCLPREGPSGAHYDLCSRAPRTTCPRSSDLGHCVGRNPGRGQVFVLHVGADRDGRCAGSTSENIGPPTVEGGTMRVAEENPAARCGVSVVSHTWRCNRIVKRWAPHAHMSRGFHREPAFRSRVGRPVRLDRAPLLPRRALEDRDRRGIRAEPVQGRATARDGSRDRSRAHRDRASRPHRRRPLGSGPGQVPPAACSGRGRQGRPPRVRAEAPGSGRGGAARRGDRPRGRAGCRLVALGRRHGPGAAPACRGAGGPAHRRHLDAGRGRQLDRDRARGRPGRRRTGIRLLRAVRAARCLDRAGPAPAAGSRPDLPPAPARHQGRRRTGALGARTVDAVRHRHGARPAGTAPARRLRRDVRGLSVRGRQAGAVPADRTHDRHRCRSDAGDPGGHRDLVRDAEGARGACRAPQRPGQRTGDAHGVRRSAARHAVIGKRRAAATRPAERLPGEVVLPGGTANQGRVVRVGDTVRRPQGSTSPATHALLRHLEAVGFDGAPRFLGVDSDEGEILPFTPGPPAAPPYPDWALTDAALVSVAELLRAYHRAVADFDPTPYVWPFSPPEAFAGELVSHNDLNLDNVVSREGRAVALIDFDLASPGSRQWDVACAARLWAPLRPDTAIDDDRRGRGLARFRLFVDSYGIPARDRSRVVDAVLENHSWFRELIRTHAEEGHAVFAEHWESDAKSRAQAFRSWLSDNEAAVREALGL